MKKFLYTIFILFFINLILLTPLSFGDDIDIETIDVNSEINSSINHSIKEPNINSRSCVVIDRNSNIILYGKNEKNRMKMASTTKIMTSIIILENTNLSDIIKASKKAANTGGSRLGLKYNDSICVKDLLYGLMLRSGNDAAVALAEYCSGSVEEFAKLMNSKASELGLSNTHFETPHGLDSDMHFTTAYELALLSNYALKNKTFADIVKTKNYNISINNISKEISNTNELLGNFNGIYGIKTGFTNGANRCLVTACKRNDMDIICVVLGADTKKLRTSDSIKLLNYVFDNFQIYNIKEFINANFNDWKAEHVKSFSINKSLNKEISLSIENPQYSCLPIRKDLIDTLNFKINYQTNYDAPLLKDSKIGTLELNINNLNIINCNIINDITIPKKNIFTYFLNFLKSYKYIFQNNFI